jgi:hypothetical protein
MKRGTHIRSKDTVAGTDSEAPRPQAEASRSRNIVLILPRLRGTCRSRAEGISRELEERGQDNPCPLNYKSDNKQKGLFCDKTGILMGRRKGLTAILKQGNNGRKNPYRQEITNKCKHAFVVIESNRFS